MLGLNFKNPKGELMILHNRFINFKSFAINLYFYKMKKIGRKLFLPLLLFSFSLSVFGQGPENNPKTEIDLVLKLQAQAWNKGNLEQYMDGYWKSDSLQFIGKNGITKGWAATLANYKKSYPDKAAMGELTFEIYSREPLGDEHYLVIGKWHLKREKDDLGGHFSLLWKKIDGKWRIIADHSS